MADGGWQSVPEDEWVEPPASDDGWVSVGVDEPAPPPSIVDTAARMGGHGASFGGDDETFSMGYGLREKLPKWAGGVDPIARLSRGTGGTPTGATAESNALEDQRAEIRQHREANPATAFAAEALGAGLVSAPLSVAAAPATTGALFAEGAILGGMYGAGESEAETFGGRAADAATAAAFGGPINAIIPAAGNKVSRWLGSKAGFSDDVMDLTARRAASPALTKDEMPSVDDAMSAPERAARWWAEKSAALRGRGMSADMAEDARILTSRGPEGAEARAAMLRGEEGGSASELAADLTALSRAKARVLDDANVSKKRLPIERRIEKGGVYPDEPDELHPPMSSYTDDVVGWEPAPAEVPDVPPDYTPDLFDPEPAPAYRAKDERRAAAARRAWERRREDDEWVAAEFEGDPVALDVWERVKNKIKPSEHRSRIEAFQEYLNDHSDEIYASQRRLEDVGAYGEESIDAYKARTTDYDDPVEQRFAEAEAAPPYDPDATAQDFRKPAPAPERDAGWMRFDEIEESIRGTAPFYYHATPAFNAPGIASRGLTPATADSTGATFGPRFAGREGTFLSRTPGASREWHEGVAESGYVPITLRARNVGAVADDARAPGAVVTAEEIPAKNLEYWDAARGEWAPLESFDAAAAFPGLGDEVSRLAALREARRRGAAGPEADLEIEELEDLILANAPGRDYTPPDSAYEPGYEISTWDPNARPAGPPGVRGGAWSKAADEALARTREAADFLKPLPVPGAALAGNRLNKAIAYYEPQIRAGLDQGGSAGAAQAFIGLDRLKRAIGYGISSKSEDVRKTSLKAFMRIRRILENADLWGEPAAAKQAAENERWTRNIRAREAGYGKFFRESPTEAIPERILVDDVEEVAEARNLPIGDLEQMTKFVERLGTEASDEGVDAATAPATLRAGVRSDADLIRILAREYDSPPEIRKEAAKAVRAARNLDRKLDRATKEQRFRRAAEELQHAHTPGLLGLVGVDAWAPKPAVAARELAILERARERGTLPSIRPQAARDPADAYPTSASGAVAAASGRSVAPSLGPMSLSPADALAAIEQDPEAFGPATQAVRAAALRGDVEGMQMAMLARQ